MRHLLLLTPMLLFGACPLTEPDKTATCEDLSAAFDIEAESVRSCSVDADCGQVLTGTSCGCTRDWVARNDADATRFYELQEELAQNSCGETISSVCDCPEAYGFACETGQCTWNYADSSTGLPDCQAEDGDAYELQDASISGDTLTITASYSGGCEAHDFTLCWPDGAFMESSPVQVSLDLFHEGHDDMCEAYLTEDHALDLTPLKTAWQEAYLQTSGTITIQLDGRTVEYTF